MPKLKKIFCNSLVLLSFFLFWQSSFCKAVSELPIFTPIGDQKQALAMQLEYLDDEDGTFSIDQVASGNAGQFKPLLKDNLGYGYKKKVLWIRFSIDFHDYADPYWFLTQNYEHVGNLSLFYPVKSGYSKSELSEEEPASKRAFNIHNYLFKIPTPETNTAVYYVRYAPQGHALNIDLSWSSLKGILENVHNAQMALGLFFGGMAAMWFYNLAICIYLRSRLYAYYVYYLGCFIGLFVYMNGFVPLLFQLNTFYEKLFAVFGYALNHGMILFGRKFLSLNQSIRWLDCCLIACQWLFVIGGICAVVLPFNPYFALNFLALFMVPFLLLGGLVRSKQGYAPAKVYSAGWIVFILMIIVFCLRQIGLLPSTWFTVYAIQIGAVWEAIIFSLALAYRLKIIEKETAVAKNTFLGMVSHELKTPLQTITSSIDLLSEKLKQPKEIEIINRMNLAAAYLEKQMKDLTDYASLESGKMKLRVGEFDASEAINQIANDYKEVAENKGLKLTSNIESSNFNVRSDVFRIQQIVNNLISNAIKYTDQGIVNIQLRYATGTSCALQIRVEDSGIGICAEDFPLIFEPFVQIDQGSTRRHEGVGMGLTIVKKSLDALNGTIKITSELGKGTIIDVHIPVESADRVNDQSIHSVESAPNHRILLVDDTEDVRIVLQSVVQALDYECDVAASGMDAVDQLSRQHYDAILLDIYMPDMDGLAVATKVQNTDGPNKKTPIIWISATEPTNISPDQRKLFSSFLQKPVRKDQLAQKLSDLVGPSNRVMK